MAEQRRQLLIKRRFQQSLILEVLLVTFILLNIIVIAGYLLIDSIADVQQLKHYLALMVAGVEVVGFAVVYRFNLKASHRIAGPVFVIERSLKQIGAGDLSFTMRLRQGDQFQEVRQQMNDSVDSLRQRIASAQRLARQIQSRDSTDSALVEQLVQELDYFKTEREAAGAQGRQASTQGQSR